MYSVTLQGHRDFESAEETEAFEKEVIERIREFAHSLPGFGGGTINTSTQAQEVLQPSDEADAINADGSPVEKAEEDTPDVPEIPPSSDEAEKASDEESGASSSDSADLSTLSTADLQAEIARRSAQ